MAQHRKNPDASRRIKEAETDESPSRLNRIVFFLLCLTLVFSVVAFGAVDAWSLGVLSFFTGLTVIFWTADALRKKEFRFNSSILQIPLLALALLGVIQLLPLGGAGASADLLSVTPSAALSVAPYLTRFAVIQLLVYVIFFAAALTFIDSHKRLQKMVLIIVIFSSAMAFYGILQRLAGVEYIYGLRPPGQAIPFASFVNQGHFAAFMEMTLGVALGLLFGKATKKDKQLLLIITAVLMGIALILTGSRGGMLSLLGVVGFIIAANLLQKQPSEDSEASGGKTSNYRRNFALLGGGLAILIVLFGSVLLLGGDDSLLRGVGLQNAADASNGRTHFWRVALRIFLDNPILGAGLDSFAVSFTRYDTWNGLMRVEQAHNDYLQILADGGIIGFLCVAAFIFLLFKQSLKIIGRTHDAFRRSAATGALAGCFGILLHSFFEFPLRTPSNAFFFLTLVALATASIHTQKLHRKKKTDRE